MDQNLQVNSNFQRSIFKLFVHVSVTLDIKIVFRTKQHFEYFSQTDADLKKQSRFSKLDTFLLRFYYNSWTFSLARRQSLGN